MGDTTSICRRGNGNAFIWHKLGFNMDLSYGTCCSFNLCNYDGGDFLQGNRRASAKTILGLINGDVALGQSHDDIRRLPH